MPGRKSPLSDRQRRFVEAYVVCLNAAEAYRRAGYSAPDEHAASANGARLMARDSIRTAIESELIARSERARVTADDVVRGLRREAEYEGPGASHGARVAALSWLGKHLALFVDRHEHTFPDDAADRALRTRLGRLAQGGAGAGPDAGGTPPRPDPSPDPSGHGRGPLANGDAALP